MLLFKEKMGYDFKCQREMDFVVSLCKEHYVSHQTMFGAKGIDNQLQVANFYIVSLKKGKKKNPAWKHDVYALILKAVYCYYS